MPSPPTLSYGMHDRYGGLLKLVFRWLFGPIVYPEAPALDLAQRAQQGSLVYITRGATTAHVLYLNHAFRRLGLPLADFVAGINLLLWQPIGRLWRMWLQRRPLRHHRWTEGLPQHAPTVDERVFAEVLLRRGSVFLSLSQNDDESTRLWLEILLAVQRECPHPIHLVPHIIASPDDAGRAQPAVERGILPLRRESLRPLHLVLSPKRVMVRVADPINLKDTKESAAALAARISAVLHEEQRVVRGPRVAPLPELCSRVESDPAVLQACVDSGVAPTRAVAKNVRSIAARYHVRYIRFLSSLLHLVFDRIFDGVLVDEEGLSRVLAAAHKGPIIFCPSHKSHIDYLVLSYVLWHHGVTPPHIAAGANLSFFPLGTLFRGSGAFFLRRSFRDDKLYAAVFSAYLRELLEAGTSIEFFLEGTRSRTGKLLMPKFGFLSMIVDAWQKGAQKDLLLVPVSIDYDRVIEARSYERELSGGRKRAETLSALIKTAGVLRSRYGSVHLQFGRPISLALAMASQAPSEATLRTNVQRLGFQLMHGIAQVCSVTPASVVATALLAHRGRGLAQSRLVEACTGILEFLHGAAARLSPVLESPENREPALLDAVQEFIESRMVEVQRSGRSDQEPIYHVPDSARLRLDFYKNALMNLYAPAALVCRAMTGMGPLIRNPVDSNRHESGETDASRAPEARAAQEYSRYFEQRSAEAARRSEGIAARSRLESTGFRIIPYGALHEHTKFLSRLFKREFVFRADATYDTHLDETLATLAARGLCDVRDDGFVEIHEPERVAQLSSMLDPFIEAYWQVLGSLAQLREFPLWKEELKSRALDTVRRAFLEGRIQRAEAANRTLVENALEWFIHAGVLVAKVDGKRTELKLADHYAGTGLEELSARIRRFL